jgi:hypothetical protein
MAHPFGEDAVVRSVMIGARKFPARSACTQRNVGIPRRGPLARGTENGVVRNWSSIKFRDLHVQHCNNLPVSPRLLAASCPLACGLNQTYLPPRATFGTLAGWSPGRISLVKRLQGMTASQREISTQIPLPILLWVTTQQSLGKHRQRAHRRRFARPPRF